MEYLKQTFTVPLGSKAYADNWSRIFGKGRKAAHEGERAEDNGAVVGDIPAELPKTEGER